MQTKLYRMAQHKTHSHLWPGVPLAISSAIFFGAGTPISKMLLGVIDPWMTAALLYLGAGLGLLVLRLFWRNRNTKAAEASLTSADLRLLCLIVFLGGVLGPVLLMFGLTRIDAGSASLLLNVEGIATMGIAWLFYKENVDRRLLLGALAILLGAVILSWNGTQFILSSGALLVIGACLAWGIDNNLSRKLSAADPVQIAIVKGLCAGAVNLALALNLGAHLPSWQIMGGAGVVGFFAIGLSLVMFMLALRHLGAARTGAYFSLAPFIGAVLSVVLLNDQVTWQLLTAGGLMLFGLLVHLAERHEHDHSHEVLEHNHRHAHDAHHTHSHDAKTSEPHSHWHRHEPISHKHPHYPDLHHQH